MTDAIMQRETSELTLPLRVADLPNREGVTFGVTPDAEGRSDLAEQLGIRKLRKLTFTGSLRPEGRFDWRLEGVLGATAIQDCVITGDPVTTRIDTPVVRLFLRRMPEVEGVEVEIPDDDTIESLGPVIDPGDVMAEALTLALPDYPRVPGASLESVPGLATESLEPERRNPFAALAALKPDPS